MLIALGLALIVCFIIFIVSLFVTYEPEYLSIRIIKDPKDK
jgi:K+-transporting ATPase A subunit